MALSESGYVYSWGDGQSPTLISNLENVSKIQTNHFMSGAVTTTGHVFLWGTTTSEEKDNKLFLKPNKISRVPQIEDAIDIAIGTYHVLVLIRSKRVVSFGYNDSGCLGLGEDNKYGYGVITELNEIKSIHCGDKSSFAIDHQGFLYGWEVVNWIEPFSGWGEGRHLDNFTSNKPVKIHGKYVEIATNNCHYMAIRDDFSLITGGDNTFGEANPQTLTFKQLKLPEHQSNGVSTISNKELKEDPKEKYSTKELIDTALEYTKFGDIPEHLDIIQSALEDLEIPQNQVKYSNKSSEQRGDIPTEEGMFLPQQSWITKPNISVVDAKLQFSQPRNNQSIPSIPVLQPQSEATNWESILRKVGIANERAEELGSLMTMAAIIPSEIAPDVLKELGFNVIERIKVIKAKKNKVLL